MGTQAVHQFYQHPLRRNSITAKVRKMDDVGFKYGAPKPINNSKIARSIKNFISKHI